MAIVEPFGEDRADLRAAVNTIAPQPDEENFDAVWSMLTDYAGDRAEDDELEIDERALQMILDEQERENNV